MSIHAPFFNYNLRVTYYTFDSPSWRKDFSNGVIDENLIEYRVFSRRRRLELATTVNSVARVRWFASYIREKGELRYSGVPRRRDGLRAAWISILRVCDAWKNVCISSTAPPEKDIPPRRARVWNRVDVVVTLSKVSIQRLSPGKVGNRKVWQSEESRKTLSGTRARRAGALRRPRIRVFRSWENTRDIPQREKRADNTFCEIELLSMPMQLQRRLSPRTRRRNARERETSNARSLFSPLLSKISR